MLCADAPALHPCCSSSTKSRWLSHAIMTVAFFDRKLTVLYAVRLLLSLNVLS
jgi:hypothetical protein